jgi:hypothetical protein
VTNSRSARRKLSTVHNLSRLGTVCESFHLRSEPCTQLSRLASCISIYRQTTALLTPTVEVRWRCAVDCFRRRLSPRQATSSWSRLQLRCTEMGRGHLPTLKDASLLATEIIRRPSETESFLGSDLLHRFDERHRINTPCTSWIIRRGCERARQERLSFPSSNRRWGPLQGISQFSNAATSNPVPIDGEGSVHALIVTSDLGET